MNTKDAKTIGKVTVGTIAFFVSTPMAAGMNKVGLKKPAEKINVYWTKKILSLDTDAATRVVRGG